MRIRLTENGRAMMDVMARHRLEFSSALGCYYIPGESINISSDEFFKCESPAELENLLLNKRQAVNN